MTPLILLAVLLAAAAGLCWLARGRIGQRLAAAVVAFAVVGLLLVPSLVMARASSRITEEPIRIAGRAWSGLVTVYAQCCGRGCGQAAGTIWKCPECRHLNMPSTMTCQACGQPSSE